MNYQIDIQNATNQTLPVSENHLILWVENALKDLTSRAELTIRIVSPDEMQHLNHIYRKQDKTTNVLAFPSNIPEAIQLDYPFLGDIIICPDVLEVERQKEEKSLEEHWALIVTHGVLHLLGYDHIEEADAIKMQSIEIKLLSELGYSNPYKLEE